MNKSKDIKRKLKKMKFKGQEKTSNKRKGLRSLEVYIPFCVDDIQNQNFMIFAVGKYQYSLLIEQ